MLLKFLAANEAIQKLLSRDFIESQGYARQMLRALVPARNFDFMNEIHWACDQRSLSSLERQFIFAKRRAQLKLRLGIHEDSREKNPHLVVIGVFQNAEGAAVGFFARKIKYAKDHLLCAFGAGLYFDQNFPRAGGVARAFMDYMDECFYRPLAIGRELIKADFVGRYIWAKLGFNFSQTYWYKDVDLQETMDLPEMARRNFGRFLQRNGIPMSDLLYFDGGQKQKINTLADLKTPMNFASIEHQGGLTLAVRPLIGFDLLGESKKLALGKAFMLSDHRPEGDEFILSMGGTRFSASAMPYWDGYRLILGG